MKKIYQEVKVDISILQGTDIIMVSSLGGSSGEAGDLEWLTGGGAVQ